MARTRLSDEFLTEAQIKRRAINDRYNKRRKEKILVDNVRHIGNTVSVEKVGLAPAGVTKQIILEKVKEGNSWHDLEKYFTTPSVILKASVSAILTSYCVYQAIQSFSAVEPDRISAITTAVSAEFILIASEIFFSISNTRLSKLLSFSFMALTMFCISSVMHNSILLPSESSKASIEMKTQERDALIKSYNLIEETISHIPADQTSKRLKEISKAQEVKAEISSLNEQIMVLNQSSSNSSIYSWWIRIASMILNAAFINSIFRRFKI